MKGKSKKGKANPTPLAKEKVARRASLTDTPLTSSSASEELGAASPKDSDSDSSTSECRPSGKRLNKCAASGSVEAFDKEHMRRRRLESAMEKNNYYERRKDSLWLRSLDDAMLQGDQQTFLKLLRLILVASGKDTSTKEAMRSSLIVILHHVRHRLFGTFRVHTMLTLLCSRNPHVQCSDSGHAYCNMLKLVVTCMEPDALRALLCAGDRNAGMTPLHWACHSNKRCMVNFLLSCGASPNLRDRFGLLPIVHAAKHTNDEIRLGTPLVWAGSDLALPSSHCRQDIRQLARAWGCHDREKGQPLVDWVIARHQKMKSVFVDMVSAASGGAVDLNTATYLSELHVFRLCESLEELCLSSPTADSVIVRRFKMEFIALVPFVFQKSEEGTSASLPQVRRVRLSLPRSPKVQPFPTGLVAESPNQFVRMLDGCTEMNNGHMFLFRFPETRQLSCSLFDFYLQIDLEAFTAEERQLVRFAARAFALCPDSAKKGV